MLDGNEPGGAIYPAQQGESAPVIYFGTGDIDKTLAQVRELGGAAEDKQPIPGIGWFARCSDTEGNAFSLFQGDESAPSPGYLPSIRAGSKSSSSGCAFPRIAHATSSPHVRPRTLPWP